MAQKRAYLRSGFYAKTKALVPAPDTRVGEALREKRQSLVADLGGADQCTTAQFALMDLIVAAWWQLESVTGYLLTLPGLVDKRHRRVWQVVRDRAALAAQLQSMLRDFGFKREERKVADLAVYLAEKDRDAATGTAS